MAIFLKILPNFFILLHTLEYKKYKQFKESGILPETSVNNEQAAERMTPNNSPYPDMDMADDAKEKKIMYVNAKDLYYLFFFFEIYKR